MNRKYAKRKPYTLSLINFDDFIRYRGEKQKIINNPDEENWKKVIVFEQMLNLYKPHEEGRYSHKNSNSETYNKENVHHYINIKHKTIFKSQEEVWENNDDFQMKKLEKMAEGIISYNDIFEGEKIKKMFNKVEERAKTRIKIKENKNKLEKRHDNKFASKQNEFYSIFENIKLKQINLQNSENRIFASRNLFKKQKQQLQNLKIKAMNQYGVVFAKQKQVKQNNSDNISLNSFIQKQKEALDKFTEFQSNHNCQPFSIKTLKGKSKLHNVQSSVNIKQFVSEVPLFLQNCLKKSNFDKRKCEVYTEKARERKKQYLRVVC